jgi:type VI secretion system FHA domain protein
LESPAEEIPGQSLDPLVLLDPGLKQAPPRKAPNVTAKDLERGSLLDVHYKPPAVVPPPSSSPPANAISIPPDYDPLAPDDVPDITPSVSPSFSLSSPTNEREVGQADEERAALPVIAPVRLPQPPRNSPSAGDRIPVATSPDPPPPGDFASVLSGAGLDPADVTPEVSRAFGQILRVVVSGVMDVMRSRQQIKDEFRMRQTRVGPVENNPLKFSANVDDALHNLLVKRNPAYLPPVEAFEDAFADLRHHQIAMLAGMRAAFESMLAEFDPDRMQEEFDRQLSKGLVPAKLRYWELFRERRHDIIKDPEASFRRLFGEEFARAYEDQLRDLEARERGSARAPSRAPKRQDT